MLGKGTYAKCGWTADKGIVVSMGHSNANMEESLNGAEAGATMITHMYNAMQSFHHR